MIFDERRKGQSDIVEWLLRQNEYLRAQQKNDIAFEVKAGEIYEVDFGINVNAEFSYRHYAIVMNDSAANNPLVTVVPIKTKKKSPHPESDVDLGLIKALNSEKESIAVINQITTVDKFRIFKKPIIGTLYEEEEREEYLSDSGGNSEKEYRIYRLEPSKYNEVRQAVINFFIYGRVRIRSQNY